MYFAVLCFLLVHSTIAGEVGILNGDTAAEGQFPWHVGVFTINGDLLLAFCSGAIISEEWVLTAATCVYGLGSDTRIASGTIDTASIDLTQNSAAETIIHENFNGTNYMYDLALIRLAKKIVFDNLTKAIQLDDQVLEADVELTISGWGATDNDPVNVTQFLQFAKVTTISNEYCASIFGADAITDEVVCALGEDPLRNPCQNDGGAALVLDAESENPKHVGVFTFMSIHGCTAHFPTGYVRTASFRDWIKEKTGV